MVLARLIDIHAGKLQSFVNRSRFNQSMVGVGMERDTALVFESLAEALRAKELIDAAGKPKYWLTFVDRVKDRDGAATRQGAGQVDGQTR